MTVRATNEAPIDVTHHTPKLNNPSCAIWASHDHFRIEEEFIHDADQESLDTKNNSRSRILIPESRREIISSGRTPTLSP